MNPHKTKHQQILDYVRDAILRGAYTAGQRLPTDGQLVLKFKTSRPTVARAMRELENEGYLERRAGSGSFVSVPAQARPSLIGLLTPELGDAELFEPICSEIAARCQKHNLSLLWADSSSVCTDPDEMEPRVLELCQRYVQMGVAGVFFAPVEFSERMTVVNREIAERMDSAGISVVLLDRDLERVPNRSRFDLVGVDNFRVGMIQTEHLIKLGCNQIAYVARELSAPSIDLRIAGYKHCLNLHEIHPTCNRVFSGNVESPEFVAKILQSKPDSIVCSNDTTAVMLLRSLVSAGISVPNDIRLIGVDDVKIAKLASVPLTTVKQHCREIGRAAVNTMIRRIENRQMAARDILVQVELVQRESCGGD